MSSSPARLLPGAPRALVAVLTCLGLAAASLAAAHGGAAGDPAAAVVAAARAHLGDGYVWGAEGPDAFDCSGFTSTLWTTVGGVRKMPRTSAQQQAWAVPIPAEQVVPGDLAFFGDPVTHVGVVSARSATGLRMVDASSSKAGVVERAVWTSGVVRFGRVPRRTMPAVRPWTPKPLAPRAPHAPAVAPARPLVSPQDPALAGRRPLVGLPSRPHRSSATATRYAALVRTQVGATTWSDTALVTALWQRAGGAVSPDSRAAIVNRTHRVLLRDARVGDLVVYPSPHSHVGVYVGAGRMVDASRSLGRVVLRPVWADPGLIVLRWDR